MSSKPLRILHLVPLVTPDASYGGPITVAFNLLGELQDRGHDVVLAAPATGFDHFPSEFLGVPVRLFTARIPFRGHLGYAGLHSMPFTLWVRRHAHTFDVVHAHLARDLTTLPTLRFAVRGLRRFAQTHGMIRLSSHPAAPILDRIFTRRTLRNCECVFALNEAEASDIRSIEPRANVEVLPNGLRTAAGSIASPADGRLPEILYLARLHARKRPDVFVDAAKLLLNQGLNARFTLVGPDEGMGPLLRERIDEHGDRIRIEGGIPPNRVTARMAEASAYVLPSINEPFGMTVLEAMSAGLPVVVTQSCELAGAVSSARAGIVVDETTESLAAALATLIREPDLRASFGRAGREYVQRSFGIGPIVDSLVDHYTRALDGVVERAGRTR